MKKACWILCAMCKRIVESLEKPLCSSLRTILGVTSCWRAWEIACWKSEVWLHAVILSWQAYYIESELWHHITQKNQKIAPHLGEIANSVYQALLHFSRAPGTSLKCILKPYYIMVSLRDYDHHSSLIAQRLWPSFLSPTSTLSLLLFLDPLILLMAGPWVESSEPTSYESRSESVSASNNFSSFEMGISRLLNQCVCMHVCV